MSFWWWMSVVLMALGQLNALCQALIAMWQALIHAKNRLFQAIANLKRDFLIANLISDWHRAGLRAKMKAKGIKFRPKPLPSPLLALPSSWMILSAVMMSMWSVAMAGPLSKLAPITWVEAVAPLRGLDPVLPPLRRPPDPAMPPSTAGEGDEPVINQLSDADLKELWEIDNLLAHDNPLGLDNLHDPDDPPDPGPFCRPCDTSSVSDCDTPSVSDLKAFAAGAQSFGHIGLLSAQSMAEAIVDSGASMTVTPHRSDFVSYQPATGEVLKGLSAGCSIAGRGLVHWRLEVGSTTIDIKLKALHVPSADARLLCPQQLKREHKPRPKRIEIEDDRIDIEFAEAEGAIHSCPLNESLLPVVMVSTPNQLDVSMKGLNACVIQERNQNLSPSQKELLKWHWKLGHLGFKRVQNLMKTGALGWHPTLKSAANLDLEKHPLICGSCAFGKAKRRTAKPKPRQKPDSSTATIKQEEKLLSKDVLIPGQKISMDHFIVSTPGRLFGSRGRESHDRMFKGGVIFVDHASGFIHVVPVVNFTAGEAIRAKREFEAEMASMGVTVLSYHTDNGVFTASQFQDELAKMNQDMTLSGVGAHHQNAVAERAIGTVTSMARTMLLHSKMRWPKGISPKLWPMAMKQAEFLCNHVPNLNNVCPMDLVMKTMTPRHLLKQVHVWGAPCYVLDPKLQDGHKIPKFDPRSRQGVNLGWSPKHASTVPLVLNLDSGHVSPQFHVVYDDWFSTVVSGESPQEAEELTSPKWINMFSNERVQVFLDPDEDLELTDEWLTEMERLEKHQRAANRVPVPDLHVPPLQSDDKPMPSTEPSQPFANAPPSTEPSQPFANAPPSTEPSQPIANAPPSPVPANLQLPTAAPPLKIPPVNPAKAQPNQHSRPSPKDTRQWKRAEIHESNILPSGTARTRRSRFKGLCCTSLMALTNQPVLRMAQQHISRPSAHLAMNGFDAVTETFDQVDWMSYQAVTTPKTKGKKGADPDFPTVQQAMVRPDWEDWRAAMIKEINTLTEMGTWSVVPRTVATAKGAKIIKSTWALRLKRAPSGEATKHKARLCVRGDLETPEDYGESFSPVVQWSTVRLMLILSIVHGLHTRQVDYVNAFAQADLQREVFMELPQGVESPNAEPCILQLHKSLYGMSDAPLMFFELLKKNLVEVGFKQMDLIDPCLFVHKHAICVTYVDDCLWFGRDERQLDKLISQMKDRMDLTIESKDVSAFLGIQFKREGKTIQLTQIGLINKIIKATGMEGCNPSCVPAESKPLGKDKDGTPFAEEWGYASVVGMLLYLAGNSRPDIAFAVNQAARFTHDPKQSHAQAIKRIVRYLQGTKEKGLTFRPSKDWQVDCYCDADFAGLWGSEDPADPIVSKSRTGFVILLAGCPLLWKSTLQTETSVSTMMAEHVALSSAMRELLPLKRLVKTIAKIVTGNDKVKITTKSDFFEDNNGALTVATMPRITPQSKFFAVKLHFFKEHVWTPQNTSGEVHIQKVDTLNQLADIMTKGLVQAKFEPLRDRLMGWDLNPDGTVKKSNSLQSPFERECQNVRLDRSPTEKKTVKFRGLFCPIKGQQISWCSQNSGDYELDSRTNNSSPKSEERDSNQVGAKGHTR